MTVTLRSNSRHMYGRCERGETGYIQGAGGGGRARGRGQGQVRV